MRLVVNNKEASMWHGEWAMRDYEALEEDHAET